MRYPIKFDFLKERTFNKMSPVINIRSLVVLALLGMPFFVIAQTTQDSTLIRTVVVEQEYNPDVMDASKINIVPKVEEPTVTKKDIEYSNEIIPATSYGAYQELLPFTQKDEQPDAKKGYARFGYGNRGLLDAKLYYLYDISSRNKLGISVSMDGRNEKVSGAQPYETEDWKYRYYRTKALLDYTHQFERLDLNIAGNFESDVFGYRGYDWETTMSQGLIQNPVVIPSVGKQHHTKAFAKFGLLSSDEDMPLRFNFQTAYLFFGRKYGIEEKDGANEHILRISGDVVGEINEEQNIGLNVLMNNMFYSELMPNYTTLDLNPYYTHEGDNWKVRLGAHVDLAFGHGKSFQASPDLHGEYNFADDYVVYADFKGGRLLNDFRRLEQLSPYFSPIISGENLKNSYIPLDGSIGLKGAPLPGLWFNIFAGYQIRKYDLCFVNNIEGYYANTYTDFLIEDTKSFYLGAALDYTYKDIVKLNFATTYYNWDSDKNEALLLKPELELVAALDIRILEKLFLNLGYDYTKRGEVAIYLPGTNSGLNHCQMNAVNNLSIGATYDITKNFSAFIKGNNLLNKDYQYYFGYPASKISFMGGLSLRF